MSRDERLHIMMSVLRSRGAFTRDEMLAELEISHPTFKRDLEFLRSRYQAEIDYDASEGIYRLATADQLRGRAKQGSKVELAGLWFSQQELQHKGGNVSPLLDPVQQVFADNLALKDVVELSIKLVHGI